GIAPLLEDRCPDAGGARFLCHHHAVARDHRRHVVRNRGRRIEHGRSLPRCRRERDKEEDKHEAQVAQEVEADTRVANPVCSLPPCGGGLGWGVDCLASLVAETRNPHPRPLPTRGRGVGPVPVSHLAWAWYWLFGRMSVADARRLVML